MTNIAIENGSFIVDLPTEFSLIFHSHVTLPEGIRQHLETHASPFFEAHLNASISAIFSFSRGTWLRYTKGMG